MNNNRNENGITELVFVLDRSGSMHGLESDTIGGFNSMIKKQQTEEGLAYVSTVLFNEKSEVIYDRIQITEVPEMTEKDYIVGGSTALLDAIGSSIKHIRNIHKYIRAEDIPEHTIFAITTDGLENTSHKYDYESVKSLIEECQEKLGWEFLFFGANIDAISEAAKVGIRAKSVTNYVADACGTSALYAELSEAISSFRTERRKK